MSNQGAHIIKLSELTDEIGVVDNKTQVVENELKDTLKGKPDPRTILPTLPSVEVSVEPAQQLDNEEEEEDETIDLINNDNEYDDVEESDESKFYKNNLKELFGEGITIIQEDEQGNEVETLVDDIVVDKDLYTEIVSSQLDAIKEEASQGKISTEGLSDFIIDLVEIDRNGGDITALMAAKETITDPLDRLDISTVEGQREAVYLRLRAAGQSDDSIKRLMRSYETEGILEEIAIKAEEELRAAVQYEVDKAKQEAQMMKEERIQKLKSYRKELKNNLTNNFQLKESITNRIVTLATKEDDKGRFEMDKLYYKFREDPEKAARLALFLLDEEEFVSQVTSKAVQNTKLETAKKIRVIKKSGTTTTPELREGGKGGRDNIVPLSSLNG